MKAFWVEGLYRTAKALKKAAKTGRPAEGVEPFAKVIWAQSAPEALRLATEALEGGQWLGEARVSQKTEEQRMRESGAPLLPGFDPTPTPTQKKGSRP